MKPIIYYIHDPMCSWCWGFKSCWDQMCEQLKLKFDIRYVVGGLAPETSEPMSDEMQKSLQQTWKRVHEITGAEFNFSFWTENIPLRSTYPACKAVLLARDARLEKEMILAIQQLYYQNAGNPSSYTQLSDVAVQLGINRDDFIQAMHGDEIEQRLRDEIIFAEMLGAQGFPSLVLEVNGEYIFIPHSYTDVAENIARIEAHL